MRSGLGKLCCLTLLMAALAAQGQAGLSQPAPADLAPLARPATADRPPANQWFTRLLSQRAGQLAQACGGRDSIAADRAYDALIAIEQTFVETLAGHFEDPDLEVRLRVVEVLRSCAAACKFYRAKSMLDQPSRQKLVKLRQSNPLLMDAVLADDIDTRVQVLRRMEELTDPQPFEPVLLLCLRHSSDSLQAGALNVVIRRHLNSDQLVDEIASLAESAFLRNSGAEAEVCNLSLQALTEMKSLRAGPRLIGILCKMSPYTQNPYMVEAVVASTDKRMIAPLIKQLQARASHVAIGDDGISFSTKDQILAVLLKITEQQPAAYGLVYVAPHSSHYYNSGYGFDNNKARADAISKFNSWWLNHKDEPAYRASAPEAPAAAKHVPAPSPISAVQLLDETSDELYDVSALQEQLRRRVEENILQLADMKCSMRQRAQQELVQLHELYLEAMTTPSALPLRNKVSIFTKALALCEFHHFLARCPAADREGLVKLRARELELLDDFLSGSAARQVESVRRIVAMNDPLAQARPLVVSALRSQHQEVMDAMLAVTLRGKYRDDGTALALCDIAASHSAAVQAGSRLEAIKSLQVIKNRVAAPTLLQLILPGQPNSFPDISVAQALAATGELGTIPLLQIVVNMPIRGSMRSLYGIELSVAPNDSAMLAIILLTSQSTDDYKMVLVGSGGMDGGMAGFKTAQDREAAIRKINKWWDENKNRPPYSTTKPLAVTLPPQVVE